MISQRFNYHPNSFILYRKSGGSSSSQELVEQSLQEMLIEIGDNDKVSISRSAPVYWPAASESFQITVAFRTVENWGSFSALDETAEMVIGLMLDSGWEVLAPDTHEIREEIQIVARPAGKFGELPRNTKISDSGEDFE